MDYAFPLDPRAVLGVPPEATLEQIREAYRAKSKRYHPDVGGEEWAFRVVARSYELLCTARVMGRASEEMARGPAASAARPASSGGGPDRRVRPGVRDSAVPPDRLVAVEMLLIRYELDNPMSLLTERPEDRNLSCTLNIAWPKPGAPASFAEGGTRPLRAALEAAFRETAQATAPTAARSDLDDIGRFVGWLSYPTATKADEAFRTFHAALQARGLGAEQTIREVTIPREWR